MAYFKHHVFFCCNQREAGEACCNKLGASAARSYAKERISALNLSAPNTIRINQAGCLGRCAEGPVLVVYPDEVWYQYLDNEDIEEIIQEHLIGGRVVERLKI